MRLASSSVFPVMVTYQGEEAVGEASASMATTPVEQGTVHPTFVVFHVILNICITAVASRLSFLFVSLLSSFDHIGLIHDADPACCIHRCHPYQVIVRSIQ